MHDNKFRIQSKEEIKGIKEAIFIIGLSLFVSPNILIRNTITKIIVIGAMLELISSVFETNAPKAPNMNE